VPHADDSPFAPADLSEIVRLYGLRNWVEQGYKQLKQELGWAHFGRLHGALRPGDPSPLAPRLLRLLLLLAGLVRHRAAAGHGGARCTRRLRHQLGAGDGENGAGADRPVARGLLATALRHVRGWLDPWTFLWRCWRAWSTAPPPPQLLALLDSVGQGRPLDFHLRR
jgi:hypothetical protein